MLENFYRVDGGVERRDLVAMPLLGLTVDLLVSLSLLIGDCSLDEPVAPELELEEDGEAVAFS